jgi:hypothetical protein
MDLERVTGEDDTFRDYTFAVDIKEASLADEFPVCLAITSFPGNNGDRAPGNRADKRSDASSAGHQEAFKLRDII